MSKLSIANTQRLSRLDTRLTPVTDLTTQYRWYW